MVYILSQNITLFLVDFLKRLFNRYRTVDGKLHMRRTGSALKILCFPSTNFLIILDVVFVVILVTAVFVYTLTKCVGLLECWKIYSLSFTVILTKASAEQLILKSTSLSGWK